VTAAAAHAADPFAVAFGAGRGAATPPPTAATAQRLGHQPGIGRSDRRGAARLGASSTSTWGGPCGGVCVYRPGAAGIQGAAYSEPGAARRQASRRRCQLGVPTTSLPWDNAKR
jgi:hypothetical protein